MNCHFISFFQLALLLCIVLFEQYHRTSAENTAYRLQAVAAQALRELPASPYHKQYKRKFAYIGQPAVYNETRPAKPWLWVKQYKEGIGQVSWNIVCRI